MIDDPHGSLPGPGWFPDPWGVAPYRWWDGLSWTSVTAPPAVAARRGGRTPVRVVLIVAAVAFFAWVAVWVLILPLLLLSDADNGRFGHDLAVVWLPEVVVALAGGAASLAMLSVEDSRPAIWKVLAFPVLAATAVAVLSAVVLPTGGG